MNEFTQATVSRTVAKHGFQLTAVGPSAVPKYVYTIGLAESFGFEFLLAGAALLSVAEITKILTQLSQSVLTNVNGSIDELPSQVSSLGEVHPSWSDQLMLGATSFHHRAVPALQPILVSSLETIDIPVASEPYSEESAPVWKWLTKEWDLAIAKSTMVMTNREALKGEPIVEVSRWDDDAWELMADSDEKPTMENCRAVPLATLLGFDSSLHGVLALPAGRSLRRESRALPWRAWGE